MSESVAHPKLVLPGDYLGASEEFLPGRGTYEDSGRIYAAVLGLSHVDPRDRTVRVEARNGVPTLVEGELVYARVEELKSAMAICTILSTAERSRAIPGTPEGTVHISKARDRYTESFEGTFAVGDLLLARVLQARPSVKLSTSEGPLGVVAARCQTCHGPMARGSTEFECPRCGARERRKLAQGFAGRPPPH